MRARAISAFNEEVIIWLTLQARLEIERTRNIISYTSDITNRGGRPGLHECCAEQAIGIPTVCQHLK
jgi:hypothetical protein